MPLIVDKWITVGEWQNDVDTNILLKNGDWIDIAAQGTIWAGVWFTGENTPRGWEGWTAGNDKPLPGSPPFCLLGRTTEDGYFYIGDGIRRTYQNATLGPGETRFFLRINDNLPGNGSGAFNVRIIVWRNPDALIAIIPAGSSEEQTLFRGGGQAASGSWRREAGVSELAIKSSRSHHRMPSFRMAFSVGMRVDYSDRAYNRRPPMARTRATGDALPRLRAWWLRQGLTPATRPRLLDACVRTAGWLQTSGSPQPLSLHPRAYVRGRQARGEIATLRGVSVIGILRVLAEAKQRGLIPAVRPLVESAFRQRVLDG